MMKNSKRILLIGAVIIPLTAQVTNLQDSIDAKLAPRSLLLSGGDLDSRQGLYMIDFPPPNQCIILGPISASTRAFALYRAVSLGGFSLKPAVGGLTVWTIEEWNSMKKKPWYAAFEARRKSECKEQ